MAVLERAILVPPRKPASSTKSVCRVMGTGGSGNRRYAPMMIRALKSEVNNSRL
jgi:hypothetical protein